MKAFFDHSWMASLPLLVRNDGLAMGSSLRGIEDAAAIQKTVRE